MILWYQIIDKAKEAKKPIIFISGDAKEDWRLEKNGKRIMPLPQLKKEMYEKAGVDFHIYTADKFLEYYDEKMDEDTINEVRKIREFEEEKIVKSRERPDISKINYQDSIHYLDLIKEVENVLIEVGSSRIHPRYIEKLNDTLEIFQRLRRSIVHGEFDRESVDFMYKLTNDLVRDLYVTRAGPEIDRKLSLKMINLMDRLVKSGEYLF